ncbi:hypothetical protein AB0M47_08650 [Hamadaea sp. NPDC051192]|uniref:hypothetical protein n=1 Tax=Hamadaea sp. NPDC051192 TaxID=3154940 RepID=UPI00342C259E
MRSDDVYYLTASGTIRGPYRKDEFTARFRAIMHLLAFEPQATVYTVHANSADEARRSLAIFLATAEQQLPP